jgi:hypothetical protein
MDKRAATGIAIGIAILVFIIRLVMAFSTPEFAFDDSYFHLRQAENIQQTGLPLFDDDLSYGGRSNLFAPAYHYLLAGMGFLFGLNNAAKILPNLLAALIPLIVFLFSWHSTQNYRSALLATFASGFIPVVWKDLASVSPDLISVVLGFVLIYFFMRSNNRKWRAAFVLCLAISAILRPITLVFILGLLIYLGIAVMAGVKRLRGEHEIIFFSLLFSIWLYFVFFKTALVRHGFYALWQNTPALILEQYFNSITVIEAVTAVGVVPFIAGVYIMYKHLFRERNRDVYLLMGVAFSTGAMVWARLVDPISGLQILGITLVLLFAIAITDLFKFIDSTKFPVAFNVASVVVLAGLVALSGIPALNQGQIATSNAVNIDEAKAFSWIKTNTDNSAVVLGVLEEGHAITYLSERGNVLDTNYILRGDAPSRIRDVQSALTAPFESESVRLMNEYGATHVLWTDGARELTGKQLPSFSSDEKCFPEVFSSGQVRVYELVCGLGDSV